MTVCAVCIYKLREKFLKFNFLIVRAIQGTYIVLNFVTIKHVHHGKLQSVNTLQELCVYIHILHQCYRDFFTRAEHQKLVKWVENGKAVNSKLQSFWCNWIVISFCPYDTSSFFNKHTACKIQFKYTCSWIETSKVQKKKIIKEKFNFHFMQRKRMQRFMKYMVNDVLEELTHALK